MLVLQRKVGERICIGDDITVTVVDVKGGRVRLGLVAPASVHIDRSEVREAKEADRGKAKEGEEAS